MGKRSLPVSEGVSPRGYRQITADNDVTMTPGNGSSVPPILDAPASRDSTNRPPVQSTSTSGGASLDSLGGKSTLMADW